MSNILSLFWTIFSLSCLIANSLTEDILGCGGFVRSDIERVKTQVEVKLYTKQGSLKDQTECAPKNGYYFLPMYDKGKYVLKIDSPPGWVFEPTEVPLVFDGKTDDCSLSRDINFDFKGFTVNGKVVSVNSNNGPAGVTVQLKKGSDVIAETTTSPDGSFAFSPVLSGSYSVHATHQRWKLKSDVAKVDVKDDNARVPDNSLVVSGYDVTGLVTSDDEPIRGVSFVLFQKGVKQGDPVQKVPNCDSSPLVFKSTGPTDTLVRQLCHVLSDEKGQFTFSSLAPGQYRVEAHYHGPHNIRFDVHPKLLDFTVLHDSIDLPANFQVRGFSVTGSVTYSKGGQGVAGASILIDGQKITETSSDGLFHLENMRTSSYTIDVIYDDLKFESQTVKISPNTPELPDIVPWGFQVCGRVVPAKLSSGHLRIVDIRGTTNDAVVAADVDVSGRFCAFLQPGEYQASVRTTDEEKSKGLQYSPVVRELVVSNKPLPDALQFSQLKAQLSGDVQCVEKDCGDIIISLVPATPGGTAQTTVTRGNRYQFVDVLPGSYHVSVGKEEWCWKTQTFDLIVKTARAVVPTFKQTGYSVTFQSSHETEVEYILQGSKKTPTKLRVTQGIMHSCVPEPGTYIFTPVGCHSYPTGSVSWSTGSRAGPVVLSAKGHTVSGWVESMEKGDDLHVDIFRDDNTLIKRFDYKVFKKETVSSPEPRRYKFSILADEGERIRFKASSSSLLFTPEIAEYVGGNDCKDGAVIIKAKKGHIVSGQVYPPLAGVQVRVIDESKESRLVATGTSPEAAENEALVLTFTTQSNGKFHGGPLHSDVKYRVTAAKEGYVITGPDSNGNFKAHKLAEVVVEVTDRADGKPLSGVLLSLSGASAYRRNSQTGPNGQMTFNSLSPGDYFLRPMMKEYRFDPPSKQFEVREGQTVEVKMSGDRVAFSAYGMVTSLSKEPEPNVVVEAVGIDDNSVKCSHYQEEASTENNGQFRIRGLQPKCKYLVRVRRSVEANKSFQRSTPENITLEPVEKDVTNLHLIVFRPVSRLDLVAYITGEQLRTVKARLYRQEAPDSPVHIAKLDPLLGPSSSKASSVAGVYPTGVLVHFPPLAVDGRTYFVQLESSLSPSSFIYETLPVQFKANSSYKQVSLVFDPRPRSMDQEMNQGSYLLLPLIIAAFLSYFNREKVIPVLQQIRQNGISFGRAAGDGLNNGNGGNRDRDVSGGANSPMIEIAANKKKPKPRKT